MGKGAGGASRRTICTSVPKNVHSLSCSETHRPKSLLPATMLAYCHGLLRLSASARHVLLMPTSSASHPYTEVRVMLVLTRKASEKVIIDGCIAVEIVAVEGNKV